MRATIGLAVPGLFAQIFCDRRDSSIDQLACYNPTSLEYLFRVLQHRVLHILAKNSNSMQRDCSSSGCSVLFLSKVRFWVRCRAPQVKGLINVWCAATVAYAQHRAYGRTTGIFCHGTFLWEGFDVVK